MMVLFWIYDLRIWLYFFPLKMADEIVDISQQHGSVDIHTSPSRKAHNRDIAYVDQISFTHWG